MITINNYKRLWMPSDPTELTQMRISSQSDSIEGLKSGLLSTQLADKNGTSSKMIARLVLKDLYINPSTLDPSVGKTWWERKGLKYAQTFSKGIFLNSPINLNVSKCYDDGYGGHVFKYTAGTINLKVKFGSLNPWGDDYYEYQSIPAPSGYFVLKRADVLSLWKGLSISEGPTYMIRGGTSSGRASVPYSSKSGNGTATFSLNRFL